MSETRASIYGLYDAHGNLRYIGKANCPRKRLKSHMADARRRTTPLYKWIKANGQPEMRVLSDDCEDWVAEERRLIAEARERGDDLLNLAPGGNQPYCPIEIRRDNCRKMNERMANGEYPKEKLTHESIIRDAYEFTLAFYIQRRRNDKILQTAARMALYAMEQPLFFHDWANPRVPQFYPNP